MSLRTFDWRVLYFSLHTGVSSADEGLMLMVTAETLLERLGRSVYVEFSLVVHGRGAE